MEYADLGSTGTNPRTRSHARRVGETGRFESRQRLRRGDDTVRRIPSGDCGNTRHWRTLVHERLRRNRGGESAARSDRRGKTIAEATSFSLTRQQRIEQLPKEESTPPPPIYGQRRLVSATFVPAGEPCSGFKLVLQILHTSPLPGKSTQSSSAVYAPPRRLVRATTVLLSSRWKVTARRNSPIRTFRRGLFWSGSP